MRWPLKRLKERAGSGELINGFRYKGVGARGAPVRRIPVGDLPWAMGRRAQLLGQKRAGSALEVQAKLGARGRHTDLIVPASLRSRKPGRLQA